MNTFALLGSPVTHSLSPQLHNGWFASEGLPGRYVALDVPRDTPAHDLLALLDTHPLAGANLTVPHKTTLLPLLDEVGPVAQRLGAVNTLVRDGHRWTGHNTDVHGFREELLTTGAAPDGLGVVLGAGGAARAVVLALEEHGYPEILVLNRTLEGADDLLRRVSPRSTSSSGPLSALQGAVRNASVVVNALSGPAQTTIRALDIRAIRSGCAWIDLNYWSDSPPHLDHLRKRGHPVGDGLTMLVHQGAKAFEHFTGRLPDPDVGLTILKAERTLRTI